MIQGHGANRFLLTPFTQLTELLRQLRLGGEQWCSLRRIVQYMHDIAACVSILLQDISDNSARRLDI